MQNATLPNSITNDLTSMDMNLASGNDIRGSHLSDPCLRYVCFDAYIN